MMRNDICKTYIQHKSNEGDAQAAIILLHLMENEEAQITDKITAEDLKNTLSAALKNLQEAAIFNERNRDDGDYSSEVQSQISSAVVKMLDIIAGI